MRTPEGYTALEVYLASLMGESISPNFITTVKEVKSFNASIVPTTVTKDFQVISDNPLQSVKIFDLTGKLVMLSSLTENNSVDISNLTKGVYLVQIKNGSGDIQQFKIIKN